MAQILYESDADLDALRDQRVAVVGYGNQGRSWALNLRDSGVDVVVCVRADETRETARADGFEAHDVEAAGDAGVICLIVPDDVIPDLPITPGPDALVIVASGYTLAFERLDPSCDAAMVAPRMLGPEVRRCYEEGIGFITAVGVHRDTTGTARARTLAVAKAIGGLRQGGIELSPMQEAVRSSGGWVEDPPSEEAVLAGGAFGMGAVPFETWIQVVLLARLRAVADGSAEPPTESSVAAHAVREWDGHPDRDALLDLLQELDATIEG